MSIFWCKVAFLEVISEGQCDLSVLEVVFKGASLFSAGGGVDVYEGLEDCVLYFSISISGSGVNCDKAVRRRDRNGDDVFFDGGSSDRSSRGSCLRFRGVELIRVI